MSSNLETRMDMESRPAANHVIDLAGARWSFVPHQPVSSALTLPIDQVDSWNWLEIGSGGPKDVLTLLKESGKIADPYVAQGDLACRWVENLDWIFRAEFQIPDTFIHGEIDYVLILNDLDCFSTVFFNRSKAGTASNFFREHRISVEEWIRPGDNELLIWVRSARHTTAALESAHGQLPGGYDTARVHARRCQCWTGWDWAARLSSAVLLTPPRIEHEPVLRLEAPFVWVKDLPPLPVGSETAPETMVSVQADILSHVKVRGNVTARVLDAAGDVVAEGYAAARAGVGRTTFRANLPMRDARLWWPLGLGPRYFYRLEVIFEGEDRLGRTTRAAAESRFAVRTVSLEQERDAAGYSFVPKVNGHPVFCRGTNWIPTRMLPGEVDDADYRLLISAAAAAGMNCLRVWGGGVYERDIFYNLCDEAGILVWQDFMFACAAYPLYKDFTDEVEAEADYQIRRLRQHPCLLLWCGNNENEWLHQIGELRAGRESSIIGEQIWSSLLKERVEELDPSRPYHQSSPFGRDRRDYNDEATGDRHNWEVWARWQSPNAYLRDHGRFISEFGMQSLPPLQSIVRYATGAESVDSPDLRHHQKMAQGHERLARYISEMMELPQSLDDWIEATQRMQAEALRRAVEHWRSLKFATAGALIWQHHDAWPAASWSLIDFYRRPKLAYLAAKRFFSPVLLSLELLENGVAVAAFSPPGIATAEDSPREPAEEGDLWLRHAGIENAEAPHSSGVVPAGATAVLPITRELRLRLINDTAYEFSGVAHVTTLSSDRGEERNLLSYPISSAANGVSEPIAFTLEELQIGDFSEAFVRVRFEPDSTASEHVAHLQSELENICAKIASDATSVPEEYRAAALSAALESDYLFVELKYFRWGDGVLVNGMQRPAWHPSHLNVAPPTPPPDLARDA